MKYPKEKDKSESSSGSEGKQQASGDKDKVGDKEKAEQQKQQSARCVGTIVTVSPPTQQPLLPGAADTYQESWPI